MNQDGWKKGWWLIALAVVNAGLTGWYLIAGPLRRGPVSTEYGSLSGSVTEHGAPVERGRISLLPERGRDKIMFRNDSSRIASDVRDGNYKITGIGPGTYLVRLEVRDQIVMLPVLKVDQGSQTHDIALPIRKKSR